MSRELLEIERRRRGMDTPAKRPIRKPRQPRRPTIRPPRAGMVTLGDLAARAGITARAIHHQRKAGALSAELEYQGGWSRWVTTEAEARRWLSEYRKHAPITPTVEG